MRIRGTNMSRPVAGRGHGKWNTKLAVTALLAACFLTPANARAGHTLTLPQQAVLHAWLAHHKNYRLATDADCDCKEDISQMKSGYGGAWPKVKDYHPYIATGDFRGSGVMDFAVAAIDGSATKDKFTLLVFDGPFHSADTSPVFVQAGLDLTHQGFSYGPPRPKPFRLVIGPFESDNSCVLNPWGHTYRLDCN